MDKPCGGEEQVEQEEDDKQGGVRSDVKKEVVLAGDVSPASPSSL
jgi:hypothetical protein